MGETRAIGESNDAKYNHVASSVGVNVRKPRLSLSREGAARERQVQSTISVGALGGGVLLAGFGLIPALGGAAVGGLLAYAFERSVDRKRSSQAR